MADRKRWRTLAHNGTTRTFLTRHECETHAQRVANQTGKWCGIEEWDESHPQGSLNQGWALVATREPITDVNLGDWVRAVRFGPSKVVDDNETVPPGTLGKVTFIDLDGVTGTRHVDWQNGRRLGVVPGHDLIEAVLPSKPCTVCGSRCAADDPTDPESYVHDEDGDWDDHTAEVTP